MRELNRLGVTGAIDAGGGFQNYPEDYAVIEKLHRRRPADRPHRLQPVHPEAEGGEGRLPAAGPERRSTSRATTTSATTAPARCWSSRPPTSRTSVEPRPDMPPEMEGELEAVVRILAAEPLAVPPARHLRRDDQPRRSTCSRRSTGTCRSTACTGSSTTPRRSPTQSIDRIAALGGGIAVQHRMAYQGEYFVERYGAGAAEATPPVARMLEMGVPVSAGTDATRVATYNPWVSLSWLVTGRTVGRLALYPAAQLPRPRDGAAACGPRTSPGSPTRRARRAGSRSASSPTWSCPTATISRAPKSEIADTASDADDRRRQGRLWRPATSRASTPPPPPAMPDWSPVRTFGGYAAWGDRKRRRAAASPHAGDGLRLRQRLRRPRPRPRQRLVEHAAGRGSQELLGRARLLLLRVLTFGRSPAHPCWSS